jgi:phytoene dehydrogenase-like protein
MTEAFDVVVIGSGYGGLITAALLGRAGKRVLVVDRVPELGGTCRSVRSGDISTPFGHAGSGDTCDIFMFQSRKHRFGMQAAERSGAQVHWVGPIEPVMRVHVLATGDVCGLGGGFREYAHRVFGVPTDLIDEMRVWWGELLGLDPREWFDVPLSDWMSKLPSAELRRAFEGIANCFDTLPPEQISTGWFAKGMQTPIELFYANDPEAPGMSGFAEAYGRVIRGCGGRFALGTEVLEIGFDEHLRVTGLVLRDDLSRVTSVETNTVVFARLPDQLTSLVGRERLGSFADDAASLRRYDNDIALDVRVLSRPPLRRHDARPEDFVGWSRVLRGAERDYGGGWWFPSMTSPGLVSEGKVLMEIGHSSGRHGLRPFHDAAEARSVLDSVLEYLRDFYVDLDEVTEQSVMAIRQPPSLDSWKFGMAPRLPLRVPGVDGLYHVSAAADVDGVVQDIDANAAMQVADLILA